MAIQRTRAAAATTRATKQARAGASKRADPAVTKVFRLKSGSDVFEFRIRLGSIPVIVGPPKPPRYWTFEVALQEHASAPGVMMSGVVPGPSRPPR